MRKIRTTLSIIIILITTLTVIDSCQTLKHIGAKGAGKIGKEWFKELRKKMKKSTGAKIYDSEPLYKKLKFNNINTALKEISKPVKSQYKKAKVSLKELTDKDHKKQVHNKKTHRGKNALNGINGKKILVIGDSNYGHNPAEDNKDNDFVHRVLQDYIDGRFNSVAYTNFAKALGGDRNIYNKLYFTNYYQTVIGDIGRKESKLDYQMYAPHIIHEIRRIKPDYVIVWGRNATDNLRKNLKLQGASFKIGDSEYGKFTYYAGTKKITIIETKHPSAAFSSSKWNEFFKNEGIAIN